MGTTVLSGQSLVTIEEALQFLQDQGSPSNDQDLLKTHLNAIAAMMIKLTGRDRMLWVAADPITEYRDGRGTNRIYLRNAPVRAIDSLTINPHGSMSTAIVVPAAGSTYSDECYFDPKSGVLVLKSAIFPEGPSTAKIVYQAGYYLQDVPTAGSVADVEVLELKLIALNALARKWARWKNQRHGISSQSSGEASVTFSAEDMTKEEIKELKRYRRSLFA